VIFTTFSGNQRMDGGKVVGASFTSFGGTISSLGFYDHGLDGLAASYQFGLWDSAQNLIATTTVTPTSPLIADFRYAPIPAVTLGSFMSPQTFTIGALLPPVMNDIWLDGATLLLFAGFGGAGTGRYQNSGTLVFPTNMDTSSYYVVNGGPQVAVPEPSAISLAAISAAATLLHLARIRRARLGRRR
jgi:hypothetical protein